MTRSAGRNNSYTVLTVLILVAIHSTWLVSSACSSQLVMHNLESPAIAENMMGISGIRHVEVYLPDGYEEGRQKYPVLYWIPGAGGEASSGFYKSAIDDAIQAGRIPPVIAVFIDVREVTIFLNSPVFGNWEDFLVSELVPFIDETYRTIPEKRYRGLMGWSMGGYSSLILPILHPDVWGAIGANDPSTWVMWYFLRDEQDFPEAHRHYYNLVRVLIQNLPPDLEHFAGLPWQTQYVIRIGTSISPNPNKPLFCDLPIAPDGNWVPEVRKQHSEYDLTNPETIEENRETLENLLTIAIIVPEVVNPEDNNRILNIELIHRLREHGIPVTRLDSPGDHVSLRTERFIMLAEEILTSMMLNETSVSPIGKMAILWGETKKR